MTTTSEITAARREAEQEEAKAVGFALARLAGRLDRTLTIVARHIVQTEDTEILTALISANVDIAAYVSLARKQVTA